MTILYDNIINKIQFWSYLILICSIILCIKL